MSTYSWMDPHRRSREAISSWKKLLLEHDKRTLALVVCPTDFQGLKNQASDKDGANRLAEPHRCRQVMAFPPRPELSDLIPRNRGGASELEDSPAEMISFFRVNVSAEAIRSWKQKRRRIKYSSGDGVLNQQPGFRAAVEQSTGGKDDEPVQQRGDHVMDLALTAEAIATESVSDNGDDDGRERADLELAIASLRSKLETLQPEGTKPSDIAAAAQAPVQIGGGVDANTASIREADEGTAENEVVLSQTVTSQRSILLWDEILTVVEAMNSPRSQVQAMAYTAVSELGMDNLEDGVLHRLCVNEIFTQEDYGDDYEIAVEASERAVEASLDRTKSSQLSYQVSLSLYRILFCQKVLYLKAIPSRLLLDAILQAGKAHGRAIVDSVLLPAIRDYVGFSKLTSELVQKVMKEQTSATVIHFLSHVFEPVTGIRATGSDDRAVLDRLPVLFLSELHLAMVQTILGYSNMPCPLPTRLWTRFNSNLDLLWEQIVALITSVSSSRSSNAAAGTLKEAIDAQTASAWILRLYCSSSLWVDLSTKTRSEVARDQEAFRLSSQKLFQVLMTWTMKQGPLCPDMESLQRLREFCTARLDVKLGKGLVAKLDMFIKRKKAQ